MKVFCIALASLFICLSLFSVTRKVAVDGSQHFTTIQSAVDSSVSGDTVLVYPGRYRENVYLNARSVNLISLEAVTGDPAYADFTIIDGMSTGAGIRLYQCAQTTVIRGFTITNSTVGIAVTYDSRAKLVNCIITKNVSRGNGGGINIYDSYVYLSGLKVMNNAAVRGGGIYLTENNSITNVVFDPVNRCSVYNNLAGNGQDFSIIDYCHDLQIYLDRFSIQNPSPYYVTISNNDSDDYAVNFDILTADHQEINQDLYISTTGDDNNDGLSPATAFRTIQFALNRVAADSLNPKTIHILPGTYSKRANQQIFPVALKSWVNVVGSGMDDTVLLGKQETFGMYVTIAFFFASNITNYSVSNMSITAINEQSCCIISASESVHQRLSNLRIYDIESEWSSMINLNYSYDIVWDNVSFENITIDERNLISGYSISMKMQNCSFLNLASVYSDNSVTAKFFFDIRVKDFFFLENCLLDNVYMQSYDAHPFQITKVDDAPGPIHYRLVSCQFTSFSNVDNILQLGYSDMPNIEIINCTFADSEVESTAIYLKGDIHIANSIFYNEIGNFIEIGLGCNSSSGDYSTMIIDNSCFRYGSGCILSGNVNNTYVYNESNLGLNPLFLGDIDENNPYRFSLSADSPCINTGTPDTTGLFLPVTDLVGYHRILDEIIDMGCYEYDPTSTSDENTPEADVSSISAYPNPFSSYTTLHLYVNEGVNGKVDDYSFSKPFDISIHNLKGQKVKTIFSNSLTKGKQSTYWDGRDDQGKPCSTGIYIIKLTQDGKTITSRKVTLVK